MPLRTTHTSSLRPGSCRCESDDARSDVDTFPTSESLSSSITERECLVVGDIHGNLPRLEALLKQEGLLDRCENCDGSGMTGENEDCEYCEGDGWARTDKPVDVILLGDIGHFGKDGSPTGDMLTWRAAMLWADVILWGNHDRALIDDTQAFSGYQKPRVEVYNIITRCRWEGKLKLAHAQHGFLMTHAGLHTSFRDQRVEERLKTDPYEFAAWVNACEESVGKCNDDRVAIVNAISRKRGGNSPAGGILWRDITEKLFDGFRQVFGHSADPEHQVRYVAPSFYTRQKKDFDIWNRNRFRVDPSYCVDVGGRSGPPGNDCLAGVYLPSEKIVRVDL